MLIVVATFLGCSQAPKNVTYGWDKAIRQAELAHTFYVKRLKSYNKNLGIEQENHMSTIFKDIIDKNPANLGT